MAFNHCTPTFGSEQVTQVILSNNYFFRQYHFLIQIFSTYFNKYPAQFIYNSNYCTRAAIILLKNKKNATTKSSPNDIERFAYIQNKSNFAWELRFIWSLTSNYHDDKEDTRTVVGIWPERMHHLSLKLGCTYSFA